MRAIAIRLMIAFLCMIAFLIALGLLSFYNIQTLTSVHQKAFQREILLKNLTAQLAQTRLIAIQILGTMDPFKMDELKEDFDRKISDLTPLLLARGLDADLISSNQALYEEIFDLHYDFSIKTARTLMDTKSKDYHEIIVRELNLRADRVKMEVITQINDVHKRMIFLTASLTLAALFTALVWALSLMRSVTDKRQAEKALTGERARLLSLLENLPGLVYLQRPDSTISFANRKFRDIFDETNDIPVYRALGRDDGTGDESRPPDTGDPNLPRSTDWEGPDNRTYHMYDYPYTDIDGSPLMLSLGIDVTDRKIAENAVRESEVYHRGLFDDSPVAMFMQDFSAVWSRVDELQAGGVKDIKTHLLSNPEEVEHLAKCVVMTRANQAAVYLYEADSEEALLGGLHRILAADDRRHVIDQVATFSKGGSWFEGEARNVTLKGNTIDIILRKTLIKGPNEDHPMVLVSAVDITELHRAYDEKEQLEIQLQQAQKMEAIGTLAGGIAHDFNNILGAIIGNIELGALDIPSSHPVQKLLRNALDASQRARDLVQQILTFSRKAQEERKPVDLVSLIRESLVFLRASVPTTIEFEQKLDIQRGVVLADPTKLQQVLINLTSNAADAMTEKGGILQIDLSSVLVDPSRSNGYPDLSPGEYFELAVSDTGHGMDLDTQKRVFEPFFTTKDVGKGTGMGLAVVHGIVKSHGGEIKVESRIGQGTTFYIMLPKSRHGLTSESPELETLKPGEESILLVDDEVVLIDINKSMLEKLGYRVTAFTDPTKAFELFNEKPGEFDLVITDMTMPRMTGAALSQKLLHVRPDIPIILLTGYTNSLSESRATEIGITEFIHKPVSIQVLSDAIRRVLDFS